jgi:sterol desaturase/sphingolipid hydroxylase (fatty acid hydroxylase superfamily)
MLHVLTATWFAWIFTLVCSLTVLTAAERFTARLQESEQDPLSSYVLGLKNWLTYILVGVTVSTILSQLLETAQIKPLFEIDLQAISTRSPIGYLASLIIFPFAAYFVTDFFYYWFHRAQHTLPILWRVHKVHHSVQHMNATNSAHHPGEEVLRLLLMIIPMNFLVSVNTDMTVAVAIILRGWGSLIHSNLNVNFGLLEKIVTLPRVHRIHHSVEPRHFDKNFAASFPLFDWLFGTAYFPKSGEFPRTGLDSTMQPPDIIGQILLPLKKDS